MNKTRFAAWTDFDHSNDHDHKNAVTYGEPNVPHKARPLDSAEALFTRAVGIAALTLGVCTWSASTVAGTLVNPSVTLSSLTPGATNQTLKISFTTATALDGSIDNMAGTQWAGTGYGRSLVRFAFSGFPTWWSGQGFNLVDGCSSAITIKLNGTVKTGTELMTIPSGCQVASGVMLVIPMEPSYNVPSGPFAPVIPAGTLVEISVAGVTVPGSNSLTNSVFLKTTDNGGNDVDTVAGPLIPVLPNSAPTATGLSVTGTAQVGTQLAGSYTYADTDNDVEGVSTFRWVRNSVNTGVAGGSNMATTQNYTPVNADVGNFLYFCVTPVASTGTATGTEVCSGATAQVVAAVNGTCGNAAGQSFIARPIDNLCSAGTPGSVSSASGEYAWTCVGSGGGTNASCTANWANNAGTGTGSVEINGTNNWVLNSASFSSMPAATPPAGVSFPNGILTLNLTTGTVGSNATVVVHYGTPVPAGAVYWKYGKTLTNPTDHWYQLPADRAVFAEDRRSVTLTLTDGGTGDDDLLANNSITDPGGPGVAPASSVTSVPTLSEWGVIMLSLLLAGMTTLRLRRL